MSIWPTYSDPKKSAIALPDSLLKISYVHTTELLLDILGLQNFSGVMRLPLGSKFKLEYKAWLVELCHDELLQDWAYVYLLELHREFRHRFDYWLYGQTLEVISGNSSVGHSSVKAWNTMVTTYVGPDEYEQPNASVAYRKWLIHGLSGKLQWTNRLPPLWWTHGLKKLQSIADTY